MTINGREFKRPCGRSSSEQKFLDVTYRAVFLAMGYEHCSDGVSAGNLSTVLCFRFSETTSSVFRGRIQRGELLSPPASEVQDRIVIVEVTPWFDLRDYGYLYVVFLFVLLLTWWRAKIGSRRRQALVEISRAFDALRGDSLDFRRANQELAKANVTLANFDRMFIHQASEYIDRIKNTFKSIVQYSDLEGNEKVSKVYQSFDILEDRLRKSVSYLRYPALIRYRISAYGHNLVSLGREIENLLEERKSEGRESVFRFSSRLEKGENPSISATASSDQNGEVPEAFFVEAMDSVLDNAINYADIGTPIVVSLGKDGANAVIQVSNDGPTVPENKLKDVFEFGVRVDGMELSPVMRATSDGRAAGASEDLGQEHLGIGLFITKQVVDGYQGICFMKNKPDGSGVTVTIQLPCVDGEAAAPPGWSGFQR